MRHPSQVYFVNYLTLAAAVCSNNQLVNRIPCMTTSSSVEVRLMKKLEDSALYSTKSSSFLLLVRHFTTLLDFLTS